LPNGHVICTKYGLQRHIIGEYGAQDNRRDRRLSPRDTPPANGIFRVQPGDIGIGNRITTLPEYFISQAGRAGGARSIVYQHAFQARWQHGIAIISGNDGRIERVAGMQGSP
jgi:hypothetical protein